MEGEIVAGAVDSDLMDRRSMLLLDVLWCSKLVAVHEGTVRSHLC